MRKPEKLEELLRAAHNVVCRDGIARLTLELVAREAGVSKGAVLYYFPTKNALIQAMLETHFSAADAQRKALMEADPLPPSGKFLRAMIRLICEYDELEERGGAGMLAAIANDPALLEVVRRHTDSWQIELDSDGLDPLTGQIVRLALDGLKFRDLMGIAPLPPALRTQILDHLIELATPAQNPTESV
jgi:AcrR family transcriptional regulator